MLGRAPAAAVGRSGQPDPARAGRRAGMDASGGHRAPAAVPAARGRCLAVAGGLSGEILLLRLPELTPLRSVPVPGAATCLTVGQGWLYAACAVGEEEIHCLLCRLSLRTGRVETLQTFPGLPAPWPPDREARCTLALRSGFTDLRATRRSWRPAAAASGFPARILHLGGRILAADPVLEQAPAAGCGAKKPAPGAVPRRNPGRMHNFPRDGKSFPLKGRDIP